MNLTPGGVQLLKGSDPSVQPIVQVLSVQQQQNRWKLEISDGVHSVMCVLAGHYSGLVTTNQVKQYTILQVKERQEFMASDKAGIFLLDVAVVAQSNEKIGRPVPFEEGAARPAMGQPQAVAQPQRAAAPMTGQAAVAQRPGGFAAVPQQNHNAAPGMRITPIAALNPYNNGWKIRARVTAKGDIKSWDKGPTNSGKLFSVELVDQENVPIRATFFREGVDLFYNLLQVGSVYVFSEGRVKVANRQFSAGINNEYELNFDKSSQIIPAVDSGEIAHATLNLVSIENIAQKEPKTIVDIIGVVTTVGDVNQFTSKAGKELRKAELEICDDSKASIKVALWGAKADEYVEKIREAGENPVVAIKGLSVGDYGGRTLSSISSTNIMIHPDLPDAGRIRQWFDRGGANDGLAQLSGGGYEGGNQGGARPALALEERDTFETAKAINLGGDAAFVEISGVVMHVRREGMTYPSCPTCKKKVVQNIDQRWSCEKCSVSYDEPVHRYIVSFQAQDNSGSQWIQAFDEASQILKRTPGEVAALQQNDPQGFNEMIEGALGSEGVFRLKIKEEQYQNDSKIRYSLLSFKPTDVARESEEMLRVINLYKSRFG